MQLDRRAVYQGQAGFEDVTFYIFRRVRLAGRKEKGDSRGKNGGKGGREFGGLTEIDFDREGGSGLDQVAGAVEDLLPGLRRGGGRGGRRWAEGGGADLDLPGPVGRRLEE